MNDKNELHGKGIRITKLGRINIGYFVDDSDAPGNFISISPYKWPDLGFNIGKRCRGPNGDDLKNIYS